VLARDSWWNRAQHLSIDQRERVPHDCGDGNTLLISRDERGWRAWCFRCVDGDHVPPPPETTAEKLARIAKQRLGDTTLSSECVLPSPLEYSLDNWPEGAKLWLYKAGLSRADAGVLRIGWHPSSDRVVIPVHDACGQLIFYQARAWQKGRTPKYLGPTPKPRTLLACWGRFQWPALTEDLLSAIKIGLSDREGWCVLGTHLSDHMLHQVMVRGGAFVFLDPDPAGQRGAAKIMTQLRAYGVPCRNLVSDRDPKLLTRSQLKEIISCV
jgi:hypothetical protein